jgi:hypothetical protein
MITFIKENDMEIVRKMPMIIALGAALLAGIIGYTSKIPNREIMGRMLIAMLVFYILGLMLRSTAMDIAKTVEEKRKADDELALLEQKEAEKKEKEIEKEKGLGNNLDLSTNDYADEDYNPIPVSEFIRRELGE